MRIDNSPAYDLHNLSVLQTGPKTAATEQAERARASYHYNQTANSAEVLEAEYVEPTATQTQAAASTSQSTANRLAAELYYLNNDGTAPPREQLNLSNKQAQRYQKLATSLPFNRGTVVNIIA